jgi:hypothetical protein
VISGTYNHIKPPEVFRSRPSAVIVTCKRRKATEEGLRKEKKRVSIRFSGAFQRRDKTAPMYLNRLSQSFWWVQIPQGPPFLRGKALGAEGYLENGRGEWREVQEVRL